MEPVRAPQAEKPRLERDRPPERRREKEPLGAETVPLAGIAGLALPRGGDSSASLLQLQRLIGNRHVQRFVALAREDPAMLQGGEVSSDVESAIHASRGGGQPLDSGARASLEPAFGVDFGNVRVHTGSQADQLNRGLSARAFTTGSDIFFRQGEYSPGSSSGRELLAHELTHVVQQGGAGAAPEGEAQAKLAVGAVDDPFEREADRVARAVMDDERRAEGAGRAVRRMPVVQRAAAIRRKKKSSDVYPVTVVAATFEGAAAEFAFQYQAVLSIDEKLDWAATTAVIISNGGNVRIFTGDGKAVGEGKTFRFSRPPSLPVGVYRAGARRVLQPMILTETGAWTMADYTVKGSGDFSTDLEEQAEFDALLKGFQRGFYVVPHVREQDLPSPPEDSPQSGGDAKAEVPGQGAAAGQTPQPGGKPPEKKPDFLKIDATGKADLPAWPSAVIPLTSPVTSAGSIGTFVCRLDKYNPWVGLLANVTANLEPMAFAWEVLELGDRFTVQGKDTATRLKGVMAGYEVRARHLEDDEKTRLGTGKKQGIPEQLFRQFYNEQIKDQRAILSYAGQTVLTVVKTFAGQPDNPRIEDIIDYKFDKPGNYFVRCLATPIVPADKENVKKRATSVAGVMVSVFDIASLAEASIGTVESEQEKSESRRKDWAAEVDRLKEIQKKGDAKELAQHPFLDYEIWKAEQEVAVEEKRGKAAGDEHQLLVIQRDFLKLQIERLNGPDRPKPGRQAHQAALKAKVDELQAQLKSLEEKIGRADSKLGGAKRTGTMPAVLVDDTTGGRLNLLFSIGEDTRVNVDELEVVIADITNEKGRMFTGSGSGWQGDGRTQAWTLAMRDLRRNLGRGRGYLAFRAPEPYASLTGAGVDNPMKLEIAELDQLKETVDDAAHAATLAALIAAPFTGGASLGVLAVLAPIQAGSSLYKIFNRAFYDDLHLDTEAIGDIANIATLGLAKVGPAGKFATSGARLFATSSRIALQVFDKGQFVVIAWSTWEELTREEPPGTDPREAKTRKILALLSLLEAGAIPVASYRWPGGVHPKQATQPRPDETPGQLRPGDTGTPRPDGTPPETLPPTANQGGDGQRPAEPEPKTAPQAEPATGAEPPAGAKPAGAFEVHPDHLKSLPKDVMDKVPAVHNPDLPAGTVRLVYEIDPATGVITKLRMEIGPGTSEMIIAAHGRTAQTMLRYKGLSGRVRLLYEQVSAWISGNPQAKPGTRAWEARLEIEKLGRVIAERVAVYEAAPSDAKEQLRHELDSLEAQFLLHASEVDLFNVGGRGYVAVEGKLTGAQIAEQRGYPKAKTGYHWVYKSGDLEYRSSDLEKYPKLKYDEGIKDFVPDTGAYQEPSFPPNTPREQAFRDLGAYEPRSEFKQFLDLLVQEGLIKIPEELIPAMIEPGGLQYRRVRHKLKEPFVAALLDRATNPKRLETLPAYAEALKANPDKALALRAAAAEELIRISDGLPVKDRGNFGEAWYARLFPATDPGKPYKQVEVTPDQLNPQLPAGQEPLKDVRRLDELRGNTIYEIKNWTYPLNGDHQAELHDQAKILGHQVEVKEPAASPKAKPTVKKVQVDALVVVFITPEGSAANARFADGFLKAYPDLAITIEFHNGRGEVARVDNKKRAWITAEKGGLADWLKGAGPGP